MNFTGYKFETDASKSLNEAYRDYQNKVLRNRVDSYCYYIRKVVLRKIMGEPGTYAEIEPSRFREIKEELALHGLCVIKQENNVSERKKWREFKEAYLNYSKRKESEKQENNVSERKKWREFKEACLNYSKRKESEVAK